MPLLSPRNPRNIINKFCFVTLVFLDVNFTVKIFGKKSKKTETAKGGQHLTTRGHTIRKVKFLSKNSILTHFHEFFTQNYFDNFSREIKVVNSYKAQNHNIFTSFLPKIILTIFLVKSKLSTAKESKTSTFSRVFHPKKNRQFSREIKVEFLDKKWRFRTVCY